MPLQIISNKLYGVTFQKTVFLVPTAVRTSHLIQYSQQSSSVTGGFQGTCEGMHMHLLANESGKTQSPFTCTFSFDLAMMHLHLSAEF
jgi:hypothetical protein